jgi:hypothetical protein
MPSLIDLTGNKYGRLTVLERALSQHRHTFWKVKCDCGTEVVVQSTYMKSGKTKSCGCYQREQARHGRLRHGRASRLAKHGSEDYPKYTREIHLMRKYNLPIEQYNEMLVNQENKCFICDYEFGQKKGDCYVDHCHKTEKVRGLLCQNCNTGLGNFRDDSDRLIRAANYLAR